MWSDRAIGEANFPGHPDLPFGHRGGFQVEDARTIAFVIPLHNEAESIGRTLAAVRDPAKPVGDPMPSASAAMASPSF
jgi:hypothetical protein